MLSHPRALSVGARFFTETTMPNLKDVLGNIREALTAWKRELRDRTPYVPGSPQSDQSHQVELALTQLGELESEISLSSALRSKLAEGMQPEALVAEVLHLLYPERNTTEVGLVVDIVRHVLAAAKAPDTSKPAGRPGSRPRGGEKQ